MTADPASVYVQDHGFVVADRDADTPFETMDYSTGLAGLMESAALIYAGVDRGLVAVSADPLDRRPELDSPTQWAGLAEWEDVVEVSLHAPRGSLTIEQLERGPFDARPDLPLLSQHGPGHYRLRIYASGRDRHYDEVAEQSGERFLVLAWPAPPADPLILKATSWCGYGLRLNARRTPIPVERPSPTDDERIESHRQEMMRRRLLDDRDLRPNGDQRQP